MEVPVSTEVSLFLKECCHWDHSARMGHRSVQVLNYRFAEEVGMAAGRFVSIAVAKSVILELCIGRNAVFHANW